MQCRHALHRRRANSRISKRRCRQLARFKTCMNCESLHLLCQNTLKDAPSSCAPPAPIPPRFFTKQGKRQLEWTLQGSLPAEAFITWSSVDTCILPTCSGMSSAHKLISNFSSDSSGGISGVELGVGVLTFLPFFPLAASAPSAAATAAASAAAAFAAFRVSNSATSSALIGAAHLGGWMFRMDDLALQGR